MAFAVLAASGAVDAAAVGTAGFRAATGLPLLQAWGMTETSPIASVCRVRSTLAGKSEDELADVRTSQGIPVPGVELRVVTPGTLVDVQVMEGVV